MPDLGLEDQNDIQSRTHYPAVRDSTDTGFGGNTEETSLMAIRFKYTRFEIQRLRRKYRYHREDRSQR